MERIKEAIRLAREHRNGQTFGAQEARSRSNVLKPDQENSTKQLLLEFEILPTKRSHLDENRILSETRGNSYVAAFDMLRTRVIREMDENGWQMLMVTSPTADCGKTVSAINLALSISRHPEQHVVVIDLDLRKPRIVYDLGVTPRYELHQVLSGEVPVKDALFGIDIGGPKLSFLANSLPSSQPVEALISRQMTDILSSIRGANPKPIVIIDMPPLLVTDDVLAFLPHTDCCILAVAENQSTVKEIQNSEKLLASSNFLGCVLTKSAALSHNYY
jgi:protein-tyrosine kinase